MAEVLRRPVVQQLLVFALWLIGVVMYFSATMRPGLPTETAPLVGSAFVALTLTWDGRSLPRRGTWLMAALLLATGTAGGMVLSDTSALASLQINVGSILGGAAGTLCWAALRGTAHAAPRNAWTLLGLVAAAVVSSAVGGLAGAWRGEGYLAVTGRLGDLWMLRSAVYMLIVSIVFLTLRFGDVERWRAAPPPPRFITIWAFPVTVACFFAAYAGSNLPLAWVMLIPSLWVGLNVTPLWAAVHAFVMSLIASVISQMPFQPFSVTGVVPPSFIMDVLLAQALLLVVLLAILRDERSLAVEAETQDQEVFDAEAELLAQVFDSMGDGLIVYDHTTRTAMSNPAAHALLASSQSEGSEPLDPVTNWADFFGFCKLDGSPLADEELPGGAGREFGTVMVRFDDGGNTRLIEFTSFPASDTTMAILLADVTDAQAHLAELEKFAHTVAHDLRSPLGTLTGWVELAREEALELDDPRLLDVLDNAHDSGAEMRQVINRWLDSAVRQAGRAMPGAA